MVSILHPRRRVIGNDIKQESHDAHEDAFGLLHNTSALSRDSVHSQVRIHQVGCHLNGKISLQLFPSTECGHDSSFICISPPEALLKFNGG